MLGTLTPGFSTPPAWVYPGARFDMDFANGRYWGGYVTRRGGLSGNADSLLSETNGGAAASSFFQPDSNGILRTQPNYALRITHGMGLWIEGPSTNYALRSRGFTNATWVKDGVTVSQTQVGADGTTNGASSITATKNAATILQSITLASGVRVSSCHVKRLVGTGTVEMTQDNGTTWTDITSLLNTSTYVWVDVPSATITDPIVGFRLGTDTDSIAADFWQTENATYKTTPIFTVSSTVARGAEMPYFGLQGSVANQGFRVLQECFTGHPVSFLAEASGNGVADCILTGNSPAQLFVTGGLDGDTANGGGATTANTGTFGLGNINKVAVRQDGVGGACCMNGGAVAINLADNLLDYTVSGHGSVGNRGAGDRAINGYIKRATYWDQGITNGQMVEWTR